MQANSNELSLKAARQLFLAVVNQAISDVMEKGKAAKESERWLLSQEFDTLNEFFVRTGEYNGHRSSVRAS